MQDFRELMMKRKRNEKMTVATTMILLAAAVSMAQSGWSSNRIGSGGKDLNAVYFIDSKEGWVAGAGGFVSHTQGSGATWGAGPIGPKTSLNDITFVGQNPG